MDFCDLLRSISRMLIRNEVFDRPVQEDESFVASFYEPKDDMERSFFQFKCQERLYGSFVAFLINIISLPVVLICLMYFGLKKVKYRETSLEQLAVFLSDGKSTAIIPNSIINEFDKIESNLKESYFLAKADYCFLFKILERYPFSWHFLLKVLLKVSRYRGVMNSYHPTAFIVCNEFSFTSSIMTTYCNNNNILHINIMHGEKLYDLRDSFFRFDRCYVWDEFYKHLFIDLRADDKQFIVEIPSSLTLAKGDVPKIYDYTYYLGDERSALLKKVAGYLKILVDNGFKVAVRPHPAFSDKVKVEKLFEGIDVEDTERINISLSIKSTSGVISRFSTVLNQASFNNVEIVIDDLTDFPSYSRLVERRYRILQVKHKLLSDIVQKG